MMRSTQALRRDSSSLASSRRLLYVVYAELKEDVVRIISARKAVKREQEDYEEGKI